MIFQMFTYLTDAVQYSRVSQQSSRFNEAWAVPIGASANGVLLRVHATTHCCLFPKRLGT